jgi:hypothetical protein
MKIGDVSRLFTVENPRPPKAEMGRGQDPPADK